MPRNSPGHNRKPADVRQKEPPPSSAPHCLVIGGGFAGVSAANRLRTFGARVTIIDAARTLGGRARSDTIDGQIIDVGAQLVASSFTHTMRLLATAAGVPRELEAAPGRDLFARGSERFPIQFGSLRSLLSFSGLTAREKIRVGRYLLPLIARHHSHLDAAAERMPPSLDDESAGRFVASRVGARAAEVLVESTANAFYAAHGVETSLAFLLTLGRYGSDAKMLAPSAGWSVLLQSLLQGAEVELNCRIRDLRVDDHGVVATSEDDREWRAPAAVLATGPHAARDLLASAGVAEEALLGWLGSVVVRPSLTLALKVDAALPRTHFGIFQAATQARMVSACAIAGAKLPNRSPGDRDVVLAWPAPDIAAELASAPAERAVDAMLPEVEELVPAARGRVAHARVYRFIEGTPLPHPGFAADRAIGRRLAGDLVPSLALAGDYLTAPLVEGAVLAGARAADRLRHFLGLE